MPSQLVIACSEKLAEKELSIAFTESATAGRLCAEFSLVPHSGKILKGGIVCYDACIKEDLLKISKDLIDRFTPESAEVTQELALNSRSLFPADIHVAITGLTTEGGSESPQKPVGTMFIHILIGEKSIGVQSVFQGTAEEIILKTIDRVAELILEKLAVNKVDKLCTDSN
jgi:nicotinamide-nucleotide amidase